MTVGGEVIAVEVAERIAACCVAARGATAEEDLATYEMEDSHGLGFGLQGACRFGPSLMDPCLEACRYSVDGDASGRAASAYVAGPWETEPCCSEGVTVVDTLEEASADPVSVVSGQAYHTGCWAWPRMSK